MSRVNRVSRRTSAEDTRKLTRSVEEGEGNKHQYVRSIPNSRGEMKAKSRQKKAKKTCEKPKVEREEHMKHTESLHIQHKVNEEYTKSTLKTENRRNRASPWRRRSSRRMKRKCLRWH